MAASPGAPPGGGAHDAVLLLAFGGPVRSQDVRPFLDNVLALVDAVHEWGGA